METETVAKKVTRADLEAQMLALVKRQGEAASKLDIKAIMSIGPEMQKVQRAIEAIGKAEQATAIEAQKQARTDAEAGAKQSIGGAIVSLEGATFQGQFSRDEQGKMVFSRGAIAASKLPDALYPAATAVEGVSSIKGLLVSGVVKVQKNQLVLAEVMVQSDTAGSPRVSTGGGHRGRLTWKLPDGRELSTFEAFEAVGTAEQKQKVAQAKGGYVQVLRDKYLTELGAVRVGS